MGLEYLTPWSLCGGATVVLISLIVSESGEDMHRIRMQISLLYSPIIVIK